MQARRERLELDGVVERDVGRRAFPRDGVAAFQSARCSCQAPPAHVPNLLVEAHQEQRLDLGRLIYICRARVCRRRHGGGGQPPEHRRRNLRQHPRVYLPVFPTGLPCTVPAVNPNILATCQLKPSIHPANQNNYSSCSGQARGCIEIYLLPPSCSCSPPQEGTERAP